MGILALPALGYSLRPWAFGDAASMLAHINFPETARNMADWYPQSGYTLEMAQEWVSGGHIQHGGITHAVDFQGEAVGAAGIHPQTGFARCNAEIGYWIGPAHQRKGAGTAIVRALTELAFGDANVSRVFAPIHAHNPASQRVCEKNGFVCEGLRRLSVMKWGKAIDNVVWAAYRDTWQSRTR